MIYKIEIKRWRKEKERGTIRNRYLMGVSGCKKIKNMRIFWYFIRVLLREKKLGGMERD